MASISGRTDGGLQPFITYNTVKLYASQRLDGLDEGWVDFMKGC